MKTFITLLGYLATLSYSQEKAKYNVDCASYEDDHLFHVTCPKSWSKSLPANISASEAR